MAVVPALSAASRVLLAVVVIGSVLAVGTVHVPVLMVVSGVATAAVICAALSGTLPRKLPGPAWLILALTAFTLAQTAPLPLAALQRLAPENATIWTQALAPFGEVAPAHACLSLDPGASLVEVLKGWTYFCVFLVATAAGSRRGGLWGALLLGSSALVLALSSIAHAALDATRVFGIYEPQMGGQGLRVAPLIDPNNLAGYLNLGTMCLLSLVAMARPPLSRWLLALGIAATVGMSLLTGSRGGLLCLVGGVALLVLLMQRASKNSLAIPIQWKSLITAGGLSAALALLFAVVATGARLRHLLFDDNLSKLGVAAASLPMVKEHAWLGIGRGAFESVFPAYHANIDNGIYAHPENFVVQWLAEWGVPATVLLCLALGWLLRPARWGISASLPACGLFCGAVVLVVQNLVDLSLEIPGVAIAVWAAAGLAWGYNATGAQRLSTRPRRYVTTAALFVGGVASVIAASGAGLETLARDRELALQQMPTQKRAPTEWKSYRALLRAIVARHPAEPYFYRLAALAAWRVGGESPMPWLQRALDRGVSAGRTHYLLGQYLASRQKNNQALFELGLAIKLDPQLTTRASKLAVRLSRDPQRLERLAKQDASGAPVLVALARELRDVSCADSLYLVRESVHRAPGLATSHLTLARWLLQAARRDGICPPHTRAELLSAADQELARAAELDPAASPIPILRAKALVQAGRAPEAMQLLRAKCPSSDHRSDCIAAWIEAATQARDGSALAEVGRLATADGCDAPHCAKMHMSLGEAAEAIGDLHSAATYFERAAIDDNSARRWRAAGRVAMKLGESARALRAFENALALAPGDAGIRTELEKARHQAILSIPPP